MYCLFSFCATAEVVPEPRNASRTISPSLVDISKIRCISCSGFGVSKTGSSGNNESKCFFAILLEPTSLQSQRVSGVTPSVA